MAFDVATDVVVVGGGPAGLAAALAVSKAAPKLKVAVYERAPCLSRRGAGLALEVNGQKALRAIEPAAHKAMLDQASFLRTSRTMDVHGQLIGETGISKERQDLAQQGFKTPCLLGWYELQQVLYDQLQGHAAVHLGADFDHYKEDPVSGLLTVHFRGGAVPPVTAGLLVAADGYFSRVRRQAVGDGAPAYGKTVVWRARLPASLAVSAGVDLHESSAFFQDVGRFLFAYPISSGDYVWTVGVSDEKLAEHGLDPSSMLEHLKRGPNSAAATAAGSSTASSMGTQDQAAADVTAQDTQGYAVQDAGLGAAARERCLQAMAGFSDSVLRMIADTPRECLVEHGIYTRPASAMSPQAFGKGRVVIIGDAAHPVRPTGQGLNQSMEDCWGLGKALMGAQAVGPQQLEALQQFRQERAERLKTVVAFTTASGEAAYKRKITAEEVDKSLGADTPHMTAEEFFRYCYDVAFSDLGTLAM